MNFKPYSFLFAIGCLVFYYGVFYKKNTELTIKDTLVIGTSADYPPYAFMDLQTNTIIGFDVDVACEVVRRMGKKCVIKDIPFQSLIFGLLAGDIDIIAAGISPTPRRSKVVAFSSNYFEGDHLIALYNTKKRITSFEELTNLSIVINTGYTADLFLSKTPNINLTRLDTPSEALMALSTNSVDAFVCAQSSLNYIKKTKNLDAFNKFVIPKTGDAYALATSKHRIQFLQKINTALSSIKKDGTLKALQKKWGLK